MGSLSVGHDGVATVGFVKQTFRQQDFLADPGYAQGALVVPAGIFRILHASAIFPKADSAFTPHCQ
jgi:hypothetical protein